MCVYAIDFVWGMFSTTTNVVRDDRDRVIIWLAVIPSVITVVPIHLKFSAASTRDKDIIAGVIHCDCTTEVKESFENYGEKLPNGLESLWYKKLVKNWYYHHFTQVEMPRVLGSMLCV